LALRREVDRIDEEIVRLMAKRAETTLEIGLTKKKDSLKVRDVEREKRILDHVADLAQPLGLDPTKTRELFRQMISESVRKQRVAKPADLKGKTVLVVGGSGRMGTWLCRFLSNRGAAVKVFDPRGELDGYENVTSLAVHAKKSDIVVIASPLGTVAEDLKAVVDSGPDGLVFDVCSIKSHIVGLLRDANIRGIRISSIHPMFGPSAPSPRGRNVLICDFGSDDANKETYNLFSSWGARTIMIELDEHDRLMAYVLGLSHMTALLFAGSARRSGEKIAGLREIQGPTFEKLASISREVASESRRVYHDIQSLNPNSRQMIAAMEDAFRELRSAALDPAPKMFSRIVDSDKEYMEAE
jgi:chorismate mutase/prephenate dehydrogenase